MRRAPRWCWAAIVGSLLLAACSSPSTRPGATASAEAALSMAERRDARARLLPSGALPQLLTEAQELGLDDVAATVDDPGIEQHLGELGFRGGVERTFRGPSRTVTGAESRILVFADAAGASSFTQLVGDDPGDFFGRPSEVSGFPQAGVEGVLVDPPICDCPGAYPVLAGVAVLGHRVVWLQLTGPRVSPRRLVQLMDLPGGR